MQETERGRRTHVCHHSRVYALQRATHGPEREQHFTATTAAAQHHLQPITQLQDPLERKPSVHTTTRSMDRRLRTSNRTVPIATGHPANHEVPVSPQ
jgi:hypothetical protein